MSVLTELLSSQGRAEIFRLLFGPVSGELHLREMERRAGLSEATLRQLGKRLSGVSAQLGREVNPHVLSPEEFARRVKERDHFFTSVLETPRLFVIGSEDELGKLVRRNQHKGTKGQRFSPGLMPFVPLSLRPFVFPSAFISRSSNGH